MSKTTIETNLKTVKSSFNGFFKDLNDISLLIADSKKMEKTMKETGNYTADYISEVVKTDIETKKAPRVASIIDIIEAGCEDLKESAMSILSASDIFEDPTVSPAVTAVSVLSNEDGAKGALIIARQFAGNFPVLNLLSSTAKDPLVANVFMQKSTDEDGIDNMIGHIHEELTTLKSMNIDHDFTGLATRVYQLSKTLIEDAAVFGIDIDLSDYTALSSLYEAEVTDAMRKALGL